MPTVKLIVNDSGLEAQFRLIPKDDIREEGELDDDDDDDDEDDQAGKSDDGCKGDNQDEKIDEKTKTVDSKAEDNDVIVVADHQGEGNVQATVKAKQKPFVSLFEMQSFLIALMLPEPRLSTPPTWCRVLRCMRASNVGVFLLDEVDLDWIDDKASKFTHAFRFEMSPDWIERLTMVPLSRRAQNMTSRSEHKSNGQMFETDLNAKCKISRTSLLLSPVQLIVEKYPMPYDESIEMLRSRYNRVTDRSPLFAIDCEMCMTDRSELTKISIVDEEGRIVYNQLVKPDLPITDYLTRYSGITKAMLEHVETKLTDVQQFIRKTLPRDAIFVGHSLNNDLAALKIFHPYVIDTSVIYNRSGVRSYKPSLKSLAYEFLGKSIQCNEKIGHDSLEDAVTALELVRLKLVNGLTFGDNVALEKSLGLKYDSKTGVTHLQFDKFIDRHQVVPISYRCLDMTPGSRCLYIHDKQSPIEHEVKDSILQLLSKTNAICVVMTNAGECYVKI